MALVVAVEPELVPAELELAFAGSMAVEQAVGNIVAVVVIAADMAAADTTAADMAAAAAVEIGHMTEVDSKAP